MQNNYVLLGHQKNQKKFVAQRFTEKTFPVNSFFSVNCAGQSVPRIVKCSFTKTTTILGTNESICNRCCVEHYLVTKPSKVPSVSERKF